MSLKLAIIKDQMALCHVSYGIEKLPIGTRICRPICCLTYEVELRFQNFVNQKALESVSEKFQLFHFR